MNIVRPASAVGALCLLAGIVSGSVAANAASHPDSRQVLPVAQIQPEIQRAAGVFQGSGSQPPTTAYCEKVLKFPCYQAWQLETAYGLPDLYAKHVTGAGQTMVVVNPFGSPTLKHDLAVFDRAEHLPAPPSLKVIQPAGKVPAYRATMAQQGWAQATDLSVELAHAIAPGAAILVAETPVNENTGISGFPQIVRAEEYVIRHHLGGVISQDFGTVEQDFATAQQLLSVRGAYIQAADSGITELAATAISGVAGVQSNGETYYLNRVVSWPSSDPLVTAVGSTQLHLNAAGRQVKAATVFNDTYFVPINELFGTGRGPSALASGGGSSVIFARPSYQDSVAKTVGPQRGTPDISVSGACDGAAEVYQSFHGALPAGWYPECGPGISVPEFAGIVALADQEAGRPLGLINPYLYDLSSRHSPGIVDVTKGNNTVAFRQDGKLYTIKGFNAGPGYNLATGVGTVNAPYFVPELACLAKYSHWSWTKIAAAPGCRFG